MLFSIVTPSYNQLDWLRLCIASVRDQVLPSTLDSGLSTIRVEHIIQDAGTPGIEQLARELGAELYRDGEIVFGERKETNLQHSFSTDDAHATYTIKIFSERDGGMYDAVNRGFSKSKGEVFAYLNCDEQYLPNGLLAVQDFFRTRPSVEVALSGTIVTDSDGQYVCHRHSLVPKAHQVWYRFPVLTSSIFLRCSVITERRISFDTKWRDLGDFHFVLALINKKVRMAVCDCFTSVFADTGENMNLKPNAIQEKQQTAEMIPAAVKLLKPLWIILHRFKRLFAGHFNMKPTNYAVYTKNSLDSRVDIKVHKPTGIWWNRL
jgi:glycosyltransferase involved in cell wall biosynthesis